MQAVERRGSASVVFEARSRVLRKAWEKRSGGVMRFIIDDLAAGLPVAEIMKQHPQFTAEQVRNSREKARLRGLIRRSTPEETKVARSEAHKGQPSPFRGRTHSSETRIKMSETHRRRPLTEQEKEDIRRKVAVRQRAVLERSRLGRELRGIDMERIELLVTAEQVIRESHRPPLRVLFEQQRRPFPEDVDTQQFLTAWYAGYIAENLRGRVNGQPTPSLTRAQVAAVYERYAPGMIDGLDIEFLFISRQTFTMQRNAKPDIHFGERMTSAAQFYKNVGVSWGEA